jgi:hypothetical protein
LLTGRKLERLCDPSGHNRPGGDRLRIGVVPAGIEHHGGNELFRSLSQRPKNFAELGRDQNKRCAAPERSPAGRLLPGKFDAVRIDRTADLHAPDPGIFLISRIDLVWKCLVQKPLMAPLLLSCSRR